MKNAALKRRYLALFLPWLSAERAKRDTPIAEPFALIEKRRGAMRVVAVSPEARALGITPGLALADARALVPQLATLPHDPAADDALLDWLAHGCERYTPSVALDLPQGLILDIAGCTHPYHGERGLKVDLTARLTRLGLSANLACADTPEAARALAEFGGKDIRALPINALRVAPEVHVALRRAGLKTLGDLAVRPRAPLAARFGAAFPSLLARTLGEEDTHITPRRTPPPVLAELRFAEPIARTEAVLDTLGQLAAEVAITLAERSMGGRQFALSLFRSDGHVARLGIETGAPTRDPALLIRLFRERVDSLNDPLDPGFGYDMVRLGVFGLEQLGAAQLPLEGGTVSHEELGALIDRLGVRLGRHRLKRFVMGDSHIPEQAALALPVDAPKAPIAWPKPLSGEPPLRPLHLFDPPQQIDVMAEVPDGPPRRFRWRTKLHEVVRYEGPERIASEWWQRKKGYLPGQAGLTRDYYRVEDARGRRFWLFRHGLYGTEKVNPDWYLHGLFA